MQQCFGRRFSLTEVEVYTEARRGAPHRSVPTSLAVAGSACSESTWLRRRSKGVFAQCGSVARTAFPRPSWPRSPFTQPFSWKIGRRPSRRSTVAIEPNARRKCHHLLGGFTQGSLARSGRPESSGYGRDQSLGDQVWGGDCRTADHSMGASKERHSYMFRGPHASFDDNGPF